MSQLGRTSSRLLITRPDMTIVLRAEIGQMKITDGHHDRTIEYIVSGGTELAHGMKWQKGGPCDTDDPLPQLFQPL